MKPVHHQRGIVQMLPLDEIEKLINEHGSAAILRERIHLANDQHAALEHRLSEVVQRAQQLRQENAGLTAALAEAQERIQRLEYQIAERHNQRLEELREQILLLLAQHLGMTARQIAQGTSKHVEVVTFQLTKMAKVDLVNGSHAVNAETKWSISQEGRAYLVHHDLLK